MKKIFGQAINYLYIIAIVMIIASVFIGKLYNNQIIDSFGFLLFFVLVITKIKKLKIKKISYKQIDKLFIVGLFILTIIQCLFVYYFAMEPGWDVSMVNDIAKEYIWELPIQYEHMLYLFNYPFNFSAVFIYETLLRMSNINDYVMFYYDIFCINISLIFIYLTFRNNCKEKTLLILTCLVFLIIPYTTYSVIAYTDTFALPFVCIALYCLFKSNEISNKLTNIILFGIFIGIGMIFKTTLIILVIALFLYGVCYFDKYKKLYVIIPFIITFVITNAFGLFINHKNYSPENYHSGGMTMLYWVHAGLNSSTNGSFDVKDYLRSLEWGIRYDDESKDEVKNYYVEGIKERLNDIKGMEFIPFIINKINNSWGNGTYGSDSLLEYQPKYENRIRDFFVYGLGKDILYKFSLLIHCFLLSLLYLYAKCKDKKSLFFKLLLLGYFGYLLLFEAGGRYIFLFSPCILLIGLNSLEYIYSDELNRGSL